MKVVLRILKEPLLHFLLLAAGLFVLSDWFSATKASEERDTIVVSRQRVNGLALTFQRVWQRPPTPRELDGLVDDFIKEEVLYREALAMGLDRDDTLVRRRLRQKLEFVAEDLADAVEPTEDQLQKFLQEHPDSFRLQRRATFRHIYLNPEQRGKSLESDAQELLDALRDADETAHIEELGDPFLLPYDHQHLRERDIANQFGPEFAAHLFDRDTGAWTGPIESAYGIHLVLIQEKTAGRVPELGEVQEAVRRDWYAARRIASKDDFFQALRKKYKVVVEKPDAAGAE